MIDDVWKREMGIGLVYVVGDMWLVVNVILNVLFWLFMFYFYDIVFSFWIDLEDV